jgi:hypothetical protein
VTTTTALGQWPQGVYSLAHIALAFSPQDPLYGGPDAAPQDPLYGGPDAAESPGLQLGNVALRGERGILRVSGGALLRMHWNPFYEHLENRVLEFMELKP